MQQQVRTTNKQSHQNSFQRSLQSCWQGLTSTTGSRFLMETSFQALKWEPNWKLPPVQPDILGWIQHQAPVTGLSNGPQSLTSAASLRPGKQPCQRCEGRRKAWSRNRSRICLFRRELHTWKACSQWRQSKSTSEVWLLFFKAEVIAHFGADIETSIGNISCGTSEVILLQLLEASQNPTAKSITYQGFASSPCKVRRVPERNFPS